MGLPFRSISRAGHSYLIAGDFWTLYESGRWEPELEELLARYANPWKVFVDVGAWIGPVTLIAARMYGLVIAVEPDPVALAQLHATVEAGHLKVHIVEALAGPPGMSRLGPKPGGEFGDSMSSVLFGAAADALVLPSRPVTDILRAADVKPDDVAMVKIDVEGSELDVLDAGFLAELGHVPLLVSTHAALHPDGKAFALALIERLRGYHLTHVDGAPVNTRRVGTGYDTLLAVPR